MDFTYLNSISDGDEEFVKQFISTFQSNTEHIVEKMMKSFQDKDFTSLGKHAHQLKPSLEMLKLNTYEVCLYMQDHPEETTVEQLKSIEDSCKAATEALKKEFNV